jgi:hypothetical protein
MSPLSQTWLRDAGLLNAGRPCLIASDCLAIGGEGCEESAKNQPRIRQAVHGSLYMRRATPAGPDRPRRNTSQ